MSSYFDDIYSKRLNQYGANAAERLEKGRQANFEKFLYSSPHYLKFKKNVVGSQEEEGVFEPYFQNETKLMMYLLTRVSTKLVPGDVYEIDGDNYIVYYISQRKNSGYNRYTMLHLTHTVDLIDDDGGAVIKSFPAYFFGQKSNQLKNELKSRSRSGTLYLENLKTDSLIAAYDFRPKIDQYVIITDHLGELYYRVTGFDPASTEGIIYITIDPTYKHDTSSMPVRGPGDDEEDFFWSNGGV